MVIVETSFFRVTQCQDCMVPGYLIVSALSQALSLSRLEAAALFELGTVLSRSTLVIEEVIKPLRVYCARFGEESEALHFHLFPRTQWITDKYLEATSSMSSLVNGPLILDWTRTTYRTPDQPIEMRRAVEEAILQLRAAWNAP